MVGGKGQGRRKVNLACSTRARAVPEGRALVDANEIGTPIVAPNRVSPWRFRSLSFVISSLDVAGGRRASRRRFALFSHYHRRR